MADRKLSGVPAPSLPSPVHHHGRPGGVASKVSAVPQQNGNVDPEPGHHSPSSRSLASPLRTLRTLGGLMVPGSEGSSRPRGQSLGSALGSRTRTSRNKQNSSQQEEPDALLDLILESQCQRLEDQRASLSLLPDPEAAALCGACSPDQPSLDFYYMLIEYQSNRMEDQRCSLPDLEDVLGPVPEGQEDFFSLVQRVQSRRMDEQRASMLLRHSEDEDAPTGSAPRHHH